MLITDEATRIELQANDHGFLRGDVTLSRVGVQVYDGSQLTEAGFKPGQPVRVQRDAEDVFSEASLKSLRGLPVTVGHPPGGLITPENAAQYVVGAVGDEVRRDGSNVRSTMTIWDQKGLDAIKSGISEVSLGYNHQIDSNPGISADGQAYDARQFEIRGNHLALVSRGRCGPSCRYESIATDSAGNEPCECQTEEGKNMAQPTLISMDCDGVSIDLTETGAQLVKRKFAADAAALEDVTTKLAAADAKAKTLTEDAAKKDARISELEGQLVTANDAAKPEAIAERAKERKTVCDAAQAIAPEFTINDSMDLDEIKLGALKAKGVAGIDDKDAVSVNASFDAHKDMASNAANSDMYSGYQHSNDSAPIGSVDAEMRKSLDAEEADLSNRAMAHLERK